MKIDCQVAMRQGLEQRAQEINQQAKAKNQPRINLIPYVAGEGEKGMATQIKQMEKLISQKPDAIIVQPTDNVALSKPLLKANQQNIPVVAYDQFILEGELASYITSNNYQAGELNGEYIDSLFDDDHVIRLILVEYPNVSSTVERIDGFIDALRKEGQKYKVLKTYNAVDPTSGRKAGQEILRDFKDLNGVDVIFTVNDGGGISLINEIADPSRNSVKVATIDGDPDSIENIRKGRMTVINSAQFCSEIGRKTIDVTYQRLQGNPVPKKVLIPTFPVTKETLERYPGWSGKIPESFVKPWNQEEWDNTVIKKK